MASSRSARIVVSSSRCRHAELAPLHPRADRPPIRRVMMDEAQLKSEAAKFDALATEELFALIVPTTLQGEAYSRGALVLKGKEIFKLAAGSRVSMQCIPPKHRVGKDGHRSPFDH